MFVVKLYQHASHRTKNLLVLLLGIAVALLLSQSSFTRSFSVQLGTLGYVGAFFAGTLLVSTFTAATGVVILGLVVHQVSPIGAGVLAVCGAVISDYLIFRFVKDDLRADISFIYEKFSGHHLNKVLHTKYFSWTLPVIGALIIILPGSDEIGISLMGIAKMKTTQFVIVTLVSHITGVFIIISASKLLL